MHDKKLSFIFLLHLVNYKKFKSVKKRFLLCNFNFFRSFLPTIKYSLYHAHSRLWFAKTFADNSKNFLSPVFFIKRMFGKKNDLLNLLDSSKIKYVFKNGKSYAHIVKNKHYFKNVVYSKLLGSNIELSSINETLFEGGLFFTKEVNKPNDFNFNSNIFFNITMVNNVEIYSALTLLYLLKCNNTYSDN